MNKSITHGLAAAGLVGLSTIVYAAPTDAADDNAATTQRVQVTRQSAYKLAPQEFDDFAHAYGLETGQTLTFRRQVNRYFTQLKGEPEVEIFGQSPATFVSGTGTTIAFRDAGDTVVVTNPDALKTASSVTPLDRQHVASR